MTNLKEILEKHERWLSGEAGGQRADLRRADLSGLSLVGADLSGADLSGADLNEANLSRADLSRADLSRADLVWTNLSGVNLIGANLSRADLSRANLIGANLSGANLSGANLSKVGLGKTSGVVLLPIRDPRGYRAVSTVVDGERMIFSGCRSFTIPEALEHWGEFYHGRRAIGDMYLDALEWLEALPECAYTDSDRSRRCWRPRMAERWRSILEWSRLGF